MQIYNRTARMSAHNVPTLRGAGWLPKVTDHGTRMAINATTWQGRSWDCDPRQLGMTLSDGIHPHAAVAKLGTPAMFWESLQVGRKGPGWVIGRFPGTPGKPTGPIRWSPLSAAQVSAGAAGPLAWASSEFGSERGMENIAAYRVEGEDVVVNHVSKRSDRRLIVINPNGWEKRHPERAALIDQLDGLPILETSKFTLSPDGKVMTVESEILGKDGRPFEHVLDVSAFSLNPAELYSNPEDGELSVKIIAIDPLEDFENIGERERVAVFYNQAVDFNEAATVRGFRLDDGTFRLVVEPKYFEALANGSVRASVNDDASRTVTLSTTDHSLTVKGYSEDDIRNNGALQNLPDLLRSAVIRAWQNSEPIIAEGKSYRELWGQLQANPLSAGQLKVARKLIPDVLALENFHVDRPGEPPRPRYAIQFYRTRESRFKGVLDTPLREGESVVITRVKAAAEIVHLDEANGRKRGDREIIPLNFDPTNGHPEDFKLVRIDPRPHAIVSTGFTSPVDTALAGQHLIDPYVMWTEIMSAIWPKVDQLGFFGIFMSAAMAFPFGAQFTDPNNNPWYVRSFGTISHSIFDAKSDAGQQYFFFSGNPRFAKMVTGAAMVTGPNTDTANPVREGRLFNCRIPGRQGFIKTAIPGFYIMVIEDAESSYFFMSMFGLKTETTILPLSAGGGLDNYQLALTIQRSQRWNAGICIYTMDAAGNIAIDFVRGNSLYRFLYNAASRLWTTDSSPNVAALSEIEATAAEVKPAADAYHPLPKMFTAAESHEWTDVGTWYDVAPVKIITYLSTAILVVAGILPIPVAGTAFFLACVAAALFGWPFWAAQMAKVGVNPKDIISLTPKHLFWGDQPMTTMTKSGLDIERLGLGKFRISDRNLGNRIPAKDKRGAFWIGFAAPTIFGGSLLSAVSLAATALAGTVGATTLLFNAAPFVLGVIIARLLNTLAKRYLPNPRARSFAKSLVHWGVKNLPWAIGAITSLLLESTIAVYSIPLSLALMAGGWAVFGGWNMLNNLLIYHREQKKIFAINAPSPAPGNIQEHQADTWTNTWREIFGKSQPTFYPLEFTSNPDENIDPARIWETLAQHTTGLLAKPNPANALANLNSLVNGEGEVLIDLYEELAPMRPRSLGYLEKAEVSLWNPISWPDLFTRRGKIARLAKATRQLRGKMADIKQRDQRTAGNISLNDKAKRYEQLRELNRYVLEETLPQFTPRH